MKVVFLINRFVKAGPVNVVHNLIVQMSKMEGNEIYLLSLSNYSDDSFLEYRMEEYCEKVEVLGMNIHSKLTPGKLASRILETVGSFDVIHTHGFQPDFWVSHSQFSKKQVSTIHNNMSDDYTSRYGRLIGKLMIKMHLISLAKIQKIVLCSGSLESAYRNKIDDYISINNGINSEIFDRKFLKEEKQSSINFISVGHLSYIKNPLQIANAIKEISSTRPNVKMTFVGEGDQRDYLEKTIGDNQKLIGYTNEVLAHLRKADYFISASITEGMPNAALEALFVGLPLILSDIPSHAYLKKLFPKSIRIFRSQLELVEIICSIADQRLILDIPDYEQLKLEFSSETMSKKYKSLYQEVMKD